MSEPGGTRLSSTRSFEGRIFTVTVDRVALPNGRTVTLDMVRHPGSVVLLPMQDDGRIVLIRQYRYALDRSRPLRHPLERHRDVGALLTLLAGPRRRAG